MTTNQPRRTRNANGRSSIYYSERDLSWHGWVTVGVKDNGRPDRRHVRGQSKAAVTKKIRELERQRDDGAVRKAGQTWTVAQCLDHWLNSIMAPPAITENAWIAYEVFTTPTGEPLNPRTDYTEWKRLLDAAGVPERRLHDARHTAATVLLLLGVPDRTVMGVMGWSNSAMAARYQHIVAAVRREVATQVGGLLWQPSPTIDDRPEV